MSLSFTRLVVKTLLPMVCMVCASAAAAAESPELELAERFIDAFYAFDPSPLAKVLGQAGESREEILFYQGWARGGNYIVVDRQPCAAQEDGSVRCSITVQDDLVLALGIDFDVTDTFALTFEDGAIASVETSSNDPQLYHDARDWTWENRPALVQPPCEGTSTFDPDPILCVQGMLQGYIEFARVNNLTPRAAVH